MLVARGATTGACMIMSHHSPASRAPGGRDFAALLTIAIKYMKLQILKESMICVRRSIGVCMYRIIYDVYLVRRE